MSILSTLAGEEFNTQREQWENSLKAELKLAELGNKGVKSSVDGGAWPTLSLGGNAGIHLPVQEPWKRAAQTYAFFDPASLGRELEEDLAHGVKVFFFYRALLNDSLWEQMARTLPPETEVFLLGRGSFNPGAVGFKVAQEVSGREVHEWGGNSIQELGLLTVRLIECLALGETGIDLGVFVDSQFFRNIAKLRAAKLLALKVLEETRTESEVRFVGLTSFREWTLYERYSNMLRNDTAVASAYIGGADHAQSCGYNVLMELEGRMLDPEHRERSLRMARNTSHILALESMLGVVQDAAFGSYHLEALTQKYAEEGWKEMQRLLPLTSLERLKLLEGECGKVREKRLELVRTRRHVLAGMNDFPDAKEKLNLKEPPAPLFFRVASGFESLRLKMERLKNPPVVHVGIFGDYAALNARLNFVKNYFQLLGLEVREVMTRKELEDETGIVVLCALDEGYPELKDLSLKAQDKFIAGKFEMPGFTNLFSGQDVHGVLEGIVNRWGEK